MYGYFNVRRDDSELCLNTANKLRGEVRGKVLRGFVRKERTHTCAPVRRLEELYQILTF